MPQVSAIEGANWIYCATVIQRWHSLISRYIAGDKERNRASAARLKNAILRLIIVVLSGYSRRYSNKYESSPCRGNHEEQSGGEIRSESYIRVAINYGADLQTSREIKYFYELADRKSVLNARLGFAIH